MCVYIRGILHLYTQLYSLMQKAKTNKKPHKHSWAVKFLKNQAKWEREQVSYFGRSYMLHCSGSQTQMNNSVSTFSTYMASSWMFLLISEKSQLRITAQTFQTTGGLITILGIPVWLKMFWLLMPSNREYLIRLPTYPE